MISRNESKRCILLRLLCFYPCSLSVYLVWTRKNKNRDSTQFPARWQRQTYRASRWTAALMLDLWFKLFGGASLVRVLNSTTLCMAITWEWNLAFQLQLGYIAVFCINDDYSFSTIPVGVIDSYWWRHLRDTHLCWIIYAQYVMCKLIVIPTGFLICITRLITIANFLRYKLMFD